MATAIITGAGGQDGSYLAELLLLRDFDVCVLVPPRGDDYYSNLQTSRQYSRYRQEIVDVMDVVALMDAFTKYLPDYVFNLAAQSFVGNSWSNPTATCNVTAMGAVNVFEACRRCCKDARIYQASSSEMFGETKAPQNEQSVLQPNSLYAVSKVFAHNAARVYRESYSMHISCGILFNHESERRPERFVTTKIAKAAAAISLGKQKNVRLGNLDARRDWGYAPDYVKSMLMMLEQPTPDDYVIGTGRTHSVHEFAAMAFDRVGLDFSNYVDLSEEFRRPMDVPELQADFSKAQKVLGWEPSVRFGPLVNRMVDYWIERLK